MHISTVTYSPVEGWLQAGREPLVAGQTEDIIDAVVLALGHQRLAGEVSAQHDLDCRPARVDLPNDPLHLLERPGTGVDIGAPQLCRQKVVAAEDVERQVAVAVKSRGRTAYSTTPV